MHPQDESFHVQMYAKPMPEGTVLQQPGAGMSLIVDEKKGERYQVKRHLAQEQDNYEALTNYIEESFGISVTDYAFDLTPENLLTLLDYVRSLADNYLVEWPEGERMRLRKPVSPSHWDIHLTSNGNWLEMEGNVQLDDDIVISMAQLLEYISQSRGKFIRLNETDYLRLSDTLRKQLGRLESVSVKNHGKMQISNFQAGLLGDDVLNGEVTIKHDAKLDNLRRKISESRQLTVKVPAKLQATLRDYQLDGFRWMVRLSNWGAGTCLADDMGLGKTIQTIAYLLYTARSGASLVVAPASVVPNWRKELQRFAPALNVSILNESADRRQTIRQAGKFDIVLSTYGLLVSEAEALTEKEWNIVCLDEAHTIKNRETKTSACAMKLKSSNRLILTGTPIQNHLGELWNLFQFINPGLLGSYEQFQQKFILPIEQEHDKQRQLQLNRIVHPFMLRRTKQEVVEELPDKQEIILPVELSDDEMRIYEVIRRKAQSMVEEGGAGINVTTLAEITRLRQAACSASLVEKKWKGESSKINLLIELVGELKAGGNRALIFSQFTSFLALVRQALDKAGEEYLYLDGSITMKQREQLVQEFQQGDCPFFLISLKAGGLGLNLTGANYIIHLDPWWNPAIEQQATDRAYRIGQEQKVTAYHLVSTHTIEEKIMRLHDTKRNLADALLEGTDMSHKLTAKDLMEMLEAESGLL
ncbi:DEAD/DEAH box helicase [Bacteroides sp. UBA939]|uniref:DEAD/DEAH box helicase n=1 Tax=Bacteroides sp. UBA939 TaxID=1946092 RepID=UPI0025C473B2|nr:DEAD/DEAH box helicase [Bacteroides sp. UBA939]